ncbi:Ig-like domain-containing protein [Vibrio sp. J1-1]|uniref:Ig-like domain-containing protein n=1 Tax=Vibrio sp. J1-1 TaxID=2912251 RepID=UPI001F40DC92|nr:Ig-like domain-containing protein [Vibrio sp. J1-1]MCF7483392.1 Ig-like domain-containing protein [Vibrio sp. J1-1]
MFNFPTQPKSFASGIFKFSVTALLSYPLAFSAAAEEIAPVTGEHNTLVFLVNFQENPNEMPMTTNEAHDLVFGTINEYYQTASYGQMSLVGEVAGVFTAPFSNQSCPSAVAVADAVNAQATEAGIPIVQFDHYLYLTTHTACGTNGSSTIGGSPSEATINGNFEPRIVAHELGHSFGLRHSKALECDGYSIGEDCSVIEYGDSYDTMGNYDMGYFNTFQKERLGWMSSAISPDITVAEQDGLYTIGAYEENAGLPVALKIPRGVDPDTGEMRWFYIEYRQSLAHDNFLESRSYTFWREDVTDGIVVRIATDGNGKSSRLLHMKPNSYFKQVLGSNDWEDPSLPAGESFTDPETGITIDFISADGVKADISVQFGSSQPTLPIDQCQLVVPSITVSAVSEQTSLPGEALQYLVQVTNNNSIECDSASYQIQAAVDAGWQADVAALSLSAGQSDELLISITSASDSVAGIYSIPVTATMESDSEYSATDEVVYQIEEQVVSEPLITASDDVVTITTKEAVTIDVLGNDTLSDNTTVLGVSAPKWGSAEILNDGSVLYTPGKKFRSSDSFTYTISDGSSNSTATVEINLESIKTTGKPPKN